MKNTFGYSMKLLTRNIRSLFAFEVIYRTFMTVLLYPFLLFLLRYSLKWADFSYVTTKNIRSYLSHFSTVIILCLIILLILIFSLYNILCIITCFEASRHNIHISIFALLKLGALRLLNLFHPKRLLIVLLSVFMLPYFIIPLAINVTGDLHINLLSDMSYTPMIFITLGAVILFLAFLLFALFYILLLHSITVDKRNTKDAVRCTFSYLKSRKSSSVVRILLWLCVIMFSSFLIYSIVVIITALIIKFAVDIGRVVSVFLVTLKYINVILVFVFTCMIEPLFILILSGIYYRLRKPAHIHDIDSADSSDKKLKPKKVKIILTVCLAVGLTLNIAILSSYGKSSIVDNIEILRVPKVSAHRGSSSQAPENTLASIDKAIDNMSDYAEIDVRATKDGQIILMHDPSLKRTTGLDKYVWDMTYEQVEQLDAGSWFSDKYIGEPVPLFEDVLKEAKGKIKLNIELKPSSDDPEFVETVVELIEKYNFEKSCIITSFDYNLLKTAKQINPKINTGLISSMILGNCNMIPYADCVSMNYTYVTAEVVNYMHRNGKKVFVWTANSKESITRMLSYGVDNIITDKPVLVKEIAYSQNQNTFVKTIVKHIFKYKIPEKINPDVK